MTQYLSSQHQYNTAGIRDLLTSVFDDEDFGYFCYDHFRPVHQKFTAAMTFSRKVQLLIDHCEKQGEFEALMSRVRQINPTRYETQAPYVLETAPAEVEPVTADPEPQSGACVPESIPLVQPHPLLPDRELAPNPFGDTGSITDPDRFFDREEILRQIFEELNKGVNLSLVGESQIGKTSLLWTICSLGPTRLVPSADAPTYLSLEWVDNEDEFYEAMSDVLGLSEPLRGYKLKRALTGRRIVLCLDEMEKMTWDGFTVYVRSQLRGLADGADAALKLVIASRSPLATLFPDSPGLDSPLAGICHQLDVGPFSPAVAREFLAVRLQDTGLTFSQPQIEALVANSGGHPARLQQSAADLYRALAAQAHLATSSKPD
jgi:hypothetical protein